MSCLLSNASILRKNIFRHAQPTIINLQVQKQPDEVAQSLLLDQLKGVARHYLQGVDGELQLIAVQLPPPTVQLPTGAARHCLSFQLCPNGLSLNSSWLWYCYTNPKYCRLTGYSSYLGCSLLGPLLAVVIFVPARRLGAQQQYNVLPWLA